MDYKVHIAFGFHVNLYHSFRGDSNDERGFGGDIRVIRKIIEVLDRHNSNGTGVKGTWDFENAYSLETTLPLFACDIITDVGRRTQSNGDEILLMSYNNGLVSCMDDNELTLSIEWAVSNPSGSGVRDIFGSYAPVVRPQEMMFSPSNISVYRKLGIDALCLYYSGVPFDSFRTLIPLLPEENAFNPLWYIYKGEKIALIPAISHSDLIDYGCLGSLARRLHKAQVCGRIRNDVLIFINMDADAVLWYGLNLPFPASRLPNTGGLDGLIGEVSDLDYIEFDTPYNYLRKHQPLKAVEFCQDIADGSFDGYSSWAEKPFNHLIWTRLEKARIISQECSRLMGRVGGGAEADKAQRLMDVSFHDRLCLMSTTHFGLSAPHINRERESKALGMSERMLSNSSSALGILNREWLSKNEETISNVSVKYYKEFDYVDISDEADCVCNEEYRFTVRDKIPVPVVIPEGRNKQPFINMSISLEKGNVFDTSDLGFYGRSGREIDAAFLDIGRHDDGSISELWIAVFPGRSMPAGFDADGREKGGLRPYNERIFISDRHMSGNGIEVFCDGMEITDVRAFGRRIGGREFFRSYIRYQKGLVCSDYEFRTKSKELLVPGRGGKLAGYRFSGEIGLPGQLEPGGYTMDLFVVDGIPSLFVRMDIKYPYTEENDLISNEVAVLGNYCDLRWIEAAPIQIKPSVFNHAHVVKYNYQGDLSSYELRDFITADPRNSVLDSFNNHVTAGFAGVADASGGLLVATDRSRLSSMAFIPMRANISDRGTSISLNPFGTYYGRQRHHMTYTGGLAQKLVAVASPCLRPLAPAYNGSCTHFLLALFPFKGDMPDGNVIKYAEAFCNGGITSTIWPDGFLDCIAGDSVTLHRKPADLAGVEAGGVPLSGGVPLGLKLKVAGSVIKSWFLH